MSDASKNIPVPPPLPSLPLGEHVRSIAWAEDSRSFAVALASGEVVIVDAVENEVIRRLPAHKFGVLQVAWLFGGAGLVSSGEDGYWRWWKDQTFELVREQKERGWVEHLKCSPDGSRLAAAAGKVVKIWDRDGKMTDEYPNHPSALASLQWREDCKGIATASFGNVSLYRLGESKPYERLDWKTSHVSLAWSPNGRHIAAGSQENTVTYWRLPFREREPLHMSGYPFKVKALSWDKESRYLATAGGEMITVWDVSGKGPAGSRPKQLAGHTGRVVSLAFQRRGNMMASGCDKGAIWLWTPFRSDGGMPAAFVEGEVSAMAWSPDESRLAVGGSTGHLRILA